MASEDPKSDNRNSTKPDLVIPPLITGVFAVITTCITAISIIYAAYLSKQNQQIQATSTVISGTATQFVLLTENAPTATFPPSFTPYPTYTDQPTYTPFPTFTSVPTPDALFKDDFSDNHNGWDLSGPITLSNGELTITAKPNDRCLGNASKLCRRRSKLLYPSKNEDEYLKLWMLQWVCSWLWIRRKRRLLSQVLSVFS